MTDKNKIIDKVKKCLALSSSANEHEAAIALRQAAKLMAEYNISQEEMIAADANEFSIKASASARPPQWEVVLATCIADAFSSRVIYSRGFDGARWVFIGCDAAPELAQYAFAVLSRQARSARREHIKTSLRRCNRANKIRRADLFSDGWVSAIARQVEAFSGTEKENVAIDAYLSSHYPAVIKKTTSSRTKGRTLSDREWADYSAGSAAGASAQLNRGVNGAPRRKALTA